jgi:hypothetical protein
MMIYFLFFLLMPESAAAPKQSAAPTVVARPCTEGWDNTGADAKKKRPKNAKNVPQNKTAACVELAVPQLEIQEYLQSYFRSQEWKIGEEHLTEDSWTFSRELSRDELLGATSKNTSEARVKWTGGVALLHISTVQVADGFARTVIRASFRGYGQNADQFAQQREYWELESNGNLESSISSALKAHFKAPN